MEYKYSIIIPHKNIPDLLIRCLASIPKREDVQVIIVDDNSDPSQVDFSKFPGTEACRIEGIHTEVYFTKEGKGAGYARNFGMQHAKGAWLLFFDSDDYLETDNLNELLDTELSDQEVAVWGWNKIKDNIIENNYPQNLQTKDILFGMNEPWKKMVLHSFIKKNGIKFQESMVSNDLLYSLKLASKYPRIYFFPKIIYNWEIRNNSLSNSYYGKKLKAAMNVSIKANAFLCRIGKEEYKDKSNYYLMLFWQESHMRYWYYLIKEAICVNIDFAIRDNETVSSICCFKPNILLQIIDDLRVLLGRIKRKIM